MLTQEEMTIAWGAAKRAQSEIAREKAASLERSRERAAAVAELKKRQDDPLFDTPQGTVSELRIFEARMHAQRILFSCFLESSVFRACVYLYLVRSPTSYTLTT